MKPSAAIFRHREAVRETAFRCKTSNPRIFGSVVRGDDREGSDLDLLVDVSPEASLVDLGRLKSELEDLLGVSVDIVDASQLYPGLRNHILAEAVAV